MSLPLSHRQTVRVEHAGLVVVFHDERGLVHALVFL